MGKAAIKPMTRPSLVDNLRGGCGVAYRYPPLLQLLVIERREGSLIVTEVRFPLFFRRHEFRPDSGGAGKYQGGAGGVAEMVVETAEPALANTAGDGVRHGACGIAGGADGAPHRYTLYSDGRPPRPIKTKETGLVIRPGDVLVLESGGGWGDPAERDPAAVAVDRENGFVTSAAGAAADHLHGCRGALPENEL
jgi:N-methylhydantoinase B/oxoprolinase/acetone carboxylase alpha subunit